MKKVLFFLAIVFAMLFSGCGEVYEDVYFTISASTEKVSYMYVDACVRQKKDGILIDKVSGVFSTPYQSGSFRLKLGQVFVIQGNDYNIIPIKTTLKVYKAGSVVKEIIIDRGNFGFQVD